MATDQEKLQSLFREKYPPAGTRLLEKDIIPDKILCLSDKDVATVLLWLQPLIGPDAYRVNIHTFHSFCNDTIRQNPSLFENNPTGLVSPLEKVRLFKMLIDGFPKGHPLKSRRGDIYSGIGYLQDLFDTMKREGWAPGNLPTETDNTDKSKEGPETETSRLLQAAMNEFTPFRELMYRNNRYDPDDRIDWVIRALEENPFLLAGFRERYPYILIDEDEDIGRLRSRLVSLLGGNISLPGGNISLPGGKERRPVLQYPPGESPDIGLPIQRQIPEATSSAEITLSGRHGPNLFGIPFAQKILLLLRYLAAEHDTPDGGDAFLFEILHFDLFSIPPVEIARLSVEVAGRQFGDQRTSIRRLLYEKAHRPPRDLFDKGLPENLKRASRILEKLISDIPNLTLPALFENCILDTGILEAVRHNPDNNRQMQVLTALSTLINEESRRNPDLDLEAFVEGIDLMKANGIPLPLATEEDELRDPEIPLFNNTLAPEINDALAPEIEKAEDSLISPILEKFVMNVTALNNYLKCPLEFYYRNIVRIPSPKNEAAEFGSAVHFALQRLFEKMQAGASRLFPSKEELVEDFTGYMIRQRRSFTKEAFARRMEYGPEVLSDYYKKYHFQWNKVVAIERNIRNVIVRGVPLKGKLDKLEFQGKEVNVVDYKTGDVDKAKSRLSPPHSGNPNGGDYWRQAVFYKILVDNYGQKDWKVVSTEFDFIEPDKKKEYQKVKIAITPSDNTTVIQQIRTTWEKIQSRNFYTGCGKAGCHWCNFVKSNRLAIAWHEIKELSPLHEPKGTTFAKPS